MNAQFFATGARKRSPKALPAPLARRPGDDSPARICQQVFDSISIHANGDIVCWCVDVEGRRVYGNVFNDRIADIYNGPAYQEIREWMLRSRPDTWCPAIDTDCPLRIVPAATNQDTSNCRIKTLKLEPVTYCNLKCPVCPVETGFKQIPELRETRSHKLLPLETMLDVVAQLPDLELIEYFDYGEPFIHRDTISFLREVRRTRPGVQIVTSTNGTVLTPAQIQAIANEALMDRIVFSIDGATEESYRKYRVGGSFSKAYGKMKALVDASRAAGTWRKYVTGPSGQVQVTWQYILFEWNDSDEELALAQELARKIDVPLQWIITSGYGASKRFMPNSAEAARLMNPPDSFIYGWHVEHRLKEPVFTETPLPEKKIGVSCELREIPYSKAPGLRGYRADIKSDSIAISAPAGSDMLFEIGVKNCSGQSWEVGRTDFLRIGIQLHAGSKIDRLFDRIISRAFGRSPRLIRELPGALVPNSIVRADGHGTVSLRVTSPAQPGRYKFVIDLVQEGVCWFSQRGSLPLEISTQVE
jgi:MoaA/NifB/PqqE/SkfB family radical SAM enzyme